MNGKVLVLLEDGQVSPIGVFHDREDVFKWLPKDVQLTSHRCWTGKTGHRTVVDEWKCQSGGYRLVSYDLFRDGKSNYK